MVTVPIEPPVSGQPVPSALPAPVAPDAGFSRLLEETLAQPVVADPLPIPEPVVSEDAPSTHATVDGIPHQAGQAVICLREGQGQPVPDAARPVVSSESAPPDQEVDAQASDPPLRAEQEPEEGAEHALYPTLLPALIPQPAPEPAAPAATPTADGSSDRLVARAADAVRPHHPWENTDGRPMPVAEAGTSAPAHESRASADAEGAGAPLPPQAPAPAPAARIDFGSESPAVPETASVYDTSQPTDSAREATPQQTRMSDRAHETPASVRPADHPPVSEGIKPSRPVEALVAPAPSQPSEHPGPAATVASLGAGSQPAEPRLALLNLVTPPEELILDPTAVPVASATRVAASDRPAGPAPVETAWEARGAVLEDILAASRNRSAQGGESMLTADPMQTEVPPAHSAPDGVADGALRFVEGMEPARIPAGDESARAAVAPRQRELTLLRSTIPAQNLLHPIPEDAHNVEAAQESDLPAGIPAVESGESAATGDTIGLRPEQGVLHSPQVTSASPSGAEPARAVAPTRYEGLALDGPAQQIVTAAHLRLRGDGGTVEMRLDPPELGQVRLQVTLQDGVLVAHLGVETAAACQLLEGQAAALRSALLDCGLPVQSLEISMGLEHSSGHPAHANQEETPRWGQQSPPEGVPVSPASPAPGRSSHRVAGIDYFA